MRGRPSTGSGSATPSTHSGSRIQRTAMAARCGPPRSVPPPVPSGPHRQAAAHGRLPRRTQQLQAASTPPRAGASISVLPSVGQTTNHLPARCSQRAAQAARCRALARGPPAGGPDCQTPCRPRPAEPLFLCGEPGPGMAGPPRIWGAGPSPLPRPRSPAVHCQVAPGPILLISAKPGQRWLP